MSNYIKTGLRLSGTYIVVLLLFVVFFYPYLGLTKDNFGKWLPLYSVIFFLLLFLMVYTDMKRTGAKEKRPQYNLNPFPVKGLIYGVIGFLPYILLEVAYPLIQVQGDIALRLKSIALDGMMGPLYFIVKLAGGSVLGYIAASLALPVISALGYLAGYYGFDLAKLAGKKEAVTEKKFEKSPWNPSSRTAKSTRRSGSGQNRT